MMNYEGLKERYINGQLVNRDLYASDGDILIHLNKLGKLNIADIEKVMNPSKESLMSRLKKKLKRVKKRYKSAKKRLKTCRRRLKKRRKRSTRRSSRRRTRRKH